MNHSEERILKGLRDLSGRSPQGAPPEVGLKLKSAFHQHHARQRRIRMFIGVAALAACVVIAAVISFRETRPKSKDEGAISKITVKPTEPAVMDSPSQSLSGVAAAGPTTKGGLIKQRTTRKAVTPVNNTGNIAKGFTPLPSYDPAVPATGYQIIRVGLQDTALSQLGVAVRESNSGQRVVTDLLVDRDGMPMAYRFVGGVKTR